MNLSMNEAVVSVGSNINPQSNVAQAQENVGAIAKLLKVSQFYETTPREYAHQDNFLNGSFLVETATDFDSFRQQLKDIETQQGRVRTANKAGPRTIDLDIIVWNGTVVDRDFYHWDFVHNTVLEVKPDLEFDPQKVQLTPS